MPTVVLDSSPLRGGSLIPPPTNHRSDKRGQKRSADEALLLTPPRTVKRERKRMGKRTVTVARTQRTTRTAASKRKASSQPRSRGSAAHNESELEGTATDSEDNAPSLGDGQGRVLEFSRETKRRRTDSIDARLESLLEDADENPFLDEPKKTSPTTELDDKAEKSVRIRSPTPPVIHFGKGQEPVSPPPSKKRTVKTGKRTVTVEATIEEEPQQSAPSTPKKGRKRTGDLARDSPNNPFLDDDDSPFSVSGGPAEPRTPTAHAEKPTIAYVFRGVRAEFANPLYNLPPEVHERSLLPVTHPDYSPDPACPPKLLFPKTRKRSASPSPSPTRAGRSKASTIVAAAAVAVAASGRRNTKLSAIPQTLGRDSHDHDWSDSDDDELHVTPPRRLFH